MSQTTNQPAVCAGAPDKYDTALATVGIDQARLYLCPMLKGIRRCGRKIVVLNESPPDPSAMNLYEACRRNNFAFQIEVSTSISPSQA